MLWCQSRWLCDPDVVVAMAREDMQGFKRYVKQGREGVGMLFPGIRIRVDQDEERRGSEATAMRWSKGLKQMCHNVLERKIKNETKDRRKSREKTYPSAKQQCGKVYSRVLKRV